MSTICSDVGRAIAALGVYVVYVELPVRTHQHIALLQPFICKSQTKDFFATMDQRNQKLRWLLTIATILTLLASMAVALTPDGLTLIEFKTGLTKTSPLLANWNVSDESPCSWGGIECSRNGNVQNITLSAQVPMLEGNISPSLGKLKSLQRLVLDHNLLSGNLPPQLGTCNNLVQLWLDGNRLSGTIPKSLGNLKRLNNMLLGSGLPWADVLNARANSVGNNRISQTNSYGNNFITGTMPLEIFKNVNLKSYDVSDNNFTGDITIVLEELSKHPGIRNITMQNNSFTGTLPPSIGNATTLLWLNLWGQRGGGFGGQIPKEIGKLVNLIGLQLTFSNFSGEISHKLGNMASLQLIDLSYNSLNGTIPSSLGNLIKLEALSFRMNNITGHIPKEVGKLVNLTYIDLSLNNFIGKIPLELGNMTSLNFLNLGSNNLSGTIPSSLGNLANLTSLQLYSNNLTGAIPMNLTSLIKVQTIHLGYNNLIGSIPTNMSKMSTIVYFALQNNSISGPIPEDFGEFMPNLTIFTISTNFFSGTLPNGLCQGGKLQWLAVGFNKLHGAIPPALANCTSLIHVGLQNNQFISIPNGFGSNSSLEYLDISSNNLTGQLPIGLGANSKLSILDLSNNRLMGNISILEFSQLSQNLSVLNLARNNFTGEIPATMAMCNLLFKVDLSYNKFTGVLPLALKNLSKLETLELQGNNFIGLNPRMYLSWSSTMRTLNLAKNPWNAPIATEIESLQILQVLNLSFGGFVGFIPSQLGKLSQLEVLDLSHNNLRGKIPSELGRLMTSLVSVNISFNYFTGSLPPEWVKFFLDDPNSFQGNPGLCHHYNISTKVCLNGSSRKRAKLSIGIIAALTVGILFALIIFLAFLWWWRATANTSEKLAPLNNIIVKNLTNTLLPFTFEEIMAATENLSDAYIIGQGGHGVVYKVVSTSGSGPIAVKKIQSLNMTTALIHKSFWSEIETIGNAKHRNLVRLLGFMKWGEMGLLLYDYISKGDLHSALHKKEFNNNHVVLTWKARLNIAEGVAHGLAYLHHDYNPPIVHRDIKSSNVLLNDDLEALISDFGLAKILLASTTQPKSKQWMSSANVSGTYGYIAPEVGYGTLVTPKLDVYSYGVLLLELLTGRQPVDASYGETWHVATWVKENVRQNEGKMSDSVLDPSLLNPTNLATKSEMLFVQRIALLCTKEVPTDRPTMRDVAELLKSLSQRMEMGSEIGDNEARELTKISMLPMQT